MLLPDWAKLRRIAQQYAPMLAQAGLGIAYNAAKGLERVANAALLEKNFNHIFHFLGITNEDIYDVSFFNSLKLG